jgi:hypothetical protein
MKTLELENMGVCILSRERNKTAQWWAIILGSNPAR